MTGKKGSHADGGGKGTDGVSAGKPPHKRENPRELSHEDHHLWDFVTKTIKPLQKSLISRGDALRLAPKSQKSPKKPLKEPLPDPVSRSWLPEFGLKAPVEPVAPKDLTKNTGGLDRRTADRLRRGQLPIEAVLDLHGLRQAEAQQQLLRFLQSAHQAGRRCVLVITGKGGRKASQPGEDPAWNPQGLGDPGGVLRRMVPLWLEMNPLRPIILDYAVAKPKDGGSGAFYILLRRQRP